LNHASICLRPACRCCERFSTATCPYSLFGTRLMRWMQPHWQSCRTNGGLSQGWT
jgi:hypothetical protein